MKCIFTCYGHENITAKHKTTLEFTKDTDLRLEGDCIVGVRADFELASLKEFIKSLGNNTKIAITIEPIDKKHNEKNDNFKKNIVERINANINPNFNSDTEMVIRKSDFISERTFAIMADNAAFELNKGLVEFLTEKGNRIRVTVENS